MEDIVLEHCSRAVPRAQAAAMDEMGEIDGRQQDRCNGRDSESVSVMSSCSSAYVPREAVLPWVLSGQSCDGTASEQSRVSVIGSGLHEGSDPVLWDDSSNSSAGGTTAQCECHEGEGTTELSTCAVGKVSKESRSTGDCPPPISRKGPFLRGSLRRASSDTRFEKPRGSLLGGRARSLVIHGSPPSTDLSRGTRPWSRMGRVSEAVLRSLSGSPPSIADDQRYNEDSTPPRAGPSHATVGHGPQLEDPYCITRPLGSPASAPSEMLSPLSASGEREALDRLCKSSILETSGVPDDPLRSLVMHGRAPSPDLDGGENEVGSRRADVDRSRSSKFAVLSVEEVDTGGPCTPLEPLPRRRPRGGSAKASHVSREHPSSADNVVLTGLVTSAPFSQLDDAPTAKSPDDKGSEGTPLTPNSVWNMGSSPRGGDSPRQSEAVDMGEAASTEPVSTATRGERSPTSSPEVCGDRSGKLSPSASVEMVCGMDVEEAAGVDFHRAVAVDSRQVEVLGPLPLHEPSPFSLCNPRRCVLEDSRFSRRLKMSSHRFRKKKARGFSAGPEEDSLSGRVGPAVFASQDGNEVSADPEPYGAESFGDLEKRVALLPEPTGMGGPASTYLSTVESTPLVRSPAVVSSQYSRVEESITIYSSLTAIPARREGPLLRKGFARPAPNLSPSILQGRRQRLVSFVPVPMDWVCSRFTFRGHPFHVVNFDVVDDSAFDGATYTEGICSHSRCSRKSHPPPELVQNLPEFVSDSLGSVLWFDAAIRFLNWAAKHRRSYKGLRVLGLGEGTGVTSLALAADGAAEVFISDLPELLPLLEVNCSSKLNPRLKGRAKALALDWVDESSFPKEIEGRVDVIVCCEILYGNRFVWPGLVRVLERALAVDGEAIFAITLRNGRHDVDDFCALAKAGGKLRIAKEEYLSPEVVVVRIQLAEKSQ
ncbi:hypothetical protein FOZ62_008827 [Perkinsus olseni]|uniref:Uncharacterized protein n=1 Tax=Perkinsus olseni TaxID=32597 RepID=A0A7J6REV8_PEROL|nr:hypothetical protein FOZ62_008827 [Perkinsus olseni]